MAKEEEKHKWPSHVGLVDKLRKRTENINKATDPFNPKTSHNKKVND